MKLYEMAHVLRSKNSGPFAVTLDMLFDSEEAYRRVKNSGRITPESVAKMYHIPVENVTDFACYDPGMGIKITFLRTVPSGTVADRDVYGAQQHAPLMNIEIP